MHRFMMEARTIEDLKARLAELHQLSIDIQNNADTEGRELSEKESEQLSTVFAEFDAVKMNIATKERLAANAEFVSQSPPRRAPTDPSTQRNDPPRAAAVTTTYLGSQRKADAFGFDSLGDFAMSVRHASHASGIRDDRLSALMAPTSYGNEGIGEEGGFLVPPEFRRDVMTKVLGEDELIARTDQLTSQSNSITVPVDETTPWQTSGGILAYWDGEADQLTQTKPKLEMRQIRLNKLTALVGVSDEMLEDASQIDSYLRAKAPQKINFKVTRAIVAGSGAGEPLGILNGAATVSQAAEGGQTADTITAVNVVNMWSRLYSVCQRNAVWLANQDTMPQLQQMMLEGTSSSIPVFIPPGGFSGAPYGTIFGRPVIFTEACETLGDVGDLILTDLTQYLTATKVGGALRTETSMHLWFDYDVMAFRFILRVAGQPWWNSSITPRSGGNALSCTVTLAARA